MNLLDILLIVLLGLSTVLGLTCAISWKVILLRLKAFFSKKKGFLLVHELRKSRNNNYGISKYEKSKVTIQKRAYGIDEGHILLDYMFGIPSVTVSELTGKSINPNKPDDKKNAMSPKLIEELIMEAVLGAVGEKLLKMIQMVMVLFGIALFAVIGQCYIIFKIYDALKLAGINIPL